jgi:pimeloyl-ACP methyl ester carboxylesterase
MITTHTLILPDGRKLAYAEFGRSDGFPVLYFHGSPSSRLEPLLYGGDEVFSRVGLRIIAPDRPGMGRSDSYPKRGFADWPEDVQVLADGLGLERFSVLGNSGGCGYAAACAAKIPEKLYAAVAVSGAWRMDWPEAMNNLRPPLDFLWGLTKRAPFLLPLMLTLTKASFGVSRERILEQQKKNLPAPDYAVLELPGRLEAFIEMYRESLAVGSRGAAWDMRLYVREWDFGLDEIQMPMTLFHGELDMQVPVELARKAAGCLPNARLITYPDEAHVSTFDNHVMDIAAALRGE